jgi:hypothetical protein
MYIKRVPHNSEPNYKHVTAIPRHNQLISRSCRGDFHVKWDILNITSCLSHIQRSIFIQDIDVSVSGPPLVSVRSSQHVVLRKATPL